MMALKSESRPLGGAGSWDQHRPRFSTAGRVVTVLALVTLVIALAASFALKDRWILALPAAAAAILCLIAQAFQARRGNGVASALDLFSLVVLTQSAWLPLFGAVFGPPELTNRAASGLAGATSAAAVSALFAAIVVLGYFISPIPAPLKSVPQGRGEKVAGWMIFLGFVGLAIRIQLGLLGPPGSSSSATGPAGLMSTWLAPLLPVGSFLWYRAAGGDSRRRVHSAVLIVASAMVYLTFSMNRGVFLVPLAAMVLIGCRSLPAAAAFRRMVVFVIVACLAFLIVGQVRTALAFKSEGVTESQQSVDEYAVDSVAMYFQSPYLPGVLYEGVPAAYGVHSLVGSAARPVPQLGAEFRGTSGQDLYNYEIYRGASNDQILPTWAELERSVGIAGLAIFAWLVGALLRFAGSRVDDAASEASRFAYTFAVLWLVQVPITSIAVLSQIALYFALPLFVAGRLAQPASRSRRLAAARTE